MTKQEAAEEHVAKNGSTYNGLKVGNIRKADFLAGVEFSEEKATPLLQALELAEVELKAMYKRQGLTGSNVLTIVQKAQKEYND